MTGLRRRRPLVPCTCGHAGMSTVWHLSGCAWLEHRLGPDTARRVWWWPARTLTHRWRCWLLRGGDEFGNKTVGVRVPGGMVLVATTIPLRTDRLPDEVDVPPGSGPIDRLLDPVVAWWWGR